MAENRKNIAFEKKGIVYSGTAKGGKVKVTIPRTAPGQTMLVGVYDIANRTWHNDKLPTEIKLKFEAAFA